MKDKKALLSLIGLSVVAVLFSIFLAKYGNTCDDRGKKDGYGRHPGNHMKKSFRSFHDDKCKMCGSILEGACAVLPSPCGLLCQKDELGLNNDQVDKLKKLKSSAKKNKIKKKADLKILAIELQEILDEKSVDKTAMESKLEAIGKLRTQFARDCINTKLASRELLSAEQLKKWGTLKKSTGSGLGGGLCGNPNPVYGGRRKEKKG